MTQNLYQGVNPHLNSRLQSPGGGWESFHASFIEKLADGLDATLPPNYYPLSEESRQVTLTGQPAASDEVISTPFLEFPVTDSFDDGESLMGPVIYRFASHDLPGTPVTRIELLSPANKPGGAHYRQYLRNRRETLLAGLRLVEIDLLHESRPPLPNIPTYPDEDGARPYLIIVSDPQPNMTGGKTVVYGSVVDEPLPTIHVPLAGSDRVTVNFSSVYDHTFSGRRTFALLTDHDQDPIRIETYHQQDRARIRQRIAAIHAKSDST